ncbi:MAG: M23 family metallopeptidase [Candidatus Moranbacteria bacterium]|nr:M23 family metallopeptidase [Candidatus Moranbacteria bacterium]
MLYRHTSKVRFPLDDAGNIALRFKQRNFYDKKDWGLHLGTDIPVKSETEVYSIGNGIIVYSKLHPAKFSEKGKIAKRNWGGIIIIAHKSPKSGKIFYSLYGHLGKRLVKSGDRVKIGDTIGRIGKAMSTSNGGWEEEHLHFSIYTGPFENKILPGYYREGEKRTKLNYWKDPIIFIKNYLK